MGPSLLGGIKLSMTARRYCVLEPSSIGLQKSDVWGEIVSGISQRSDNKKLLSTWCHVTHIVLTCAMGRFRV